MADVVLDVLRGGPDAQCQSSVASFVCIFEVMGLGTVEDHQVPFLQHLWVAGCAPGGLWFSDDEGATWVSVPEVPSSVEALLTKGSVGTAR